MIQKMTEEQLALLEEEIRSAKDHLEGALSMVQDPYARGNLHRYLEQLEHSANKWLDHCLETNGSAPTVQARQGQREDSEITSGSGDAT